jgi:hypothetical protein
MEFTALQRGILNDITLLTRAISKKIASNTFVATR